MAFTQNSRSSGGKRNSMFVGNQVEQDQVIIENAKFEEMNYEYQKIQYQLNILSYFIKDYVTKNEQQKFEAIKNQAMILK